MPAATPSADLRGEAVPPPSSSTPSAPPPAVEDDPLCFEPALLMDREGRPLRQNTAFRDLDLPDLSRGGPPTALRLTPAEVEAWRRAVEDAALGRPARVELALLDPQFDRRIYEFRFRARGSGEGLRVNAIGHDVTDQRNEQEACLQCSAACHTLVDSLPVNVVQKDREGRFVFVNRRFAETLGRPKSEVLGRSDADFFSEELAFRYREDDRRVLTERQSLKLVEPFPGPDGGRRYVEVFKCPVLGRGGLAEGVLVTFWDVTERELAQQTLFRSFLETEALFASISAVLVGVDGNGRVTRWNRAAETTFGIAAAEVLGRVFFDSPIRWDWGKVRQAVIDSTVHRNTVEVPQVDLHAPDGRQHTLHLIVSPEEMSMEDSVPYTVLATDTTSQRQLEAQLRQAQKLESIGELAAGIAHEINTPTQFIGDNLRFLRESFDALDPILGGLLAAPGPLAPLVESADLAYLRREIPAAILQSLEGVARVAGIVGAMKSFSHPDGSERVEVDLNQSIQDTVTVARNEWKYVAHLVLDLDPSLPPVPCFPGNVNQAVLNLIVNAAHAIAETPAVKAGGKGTITVGTRVVGPEVEIRVQDTGGGIPQEIHGRIFDPFFTTKPVGKGTGQGLFIVHTVVVEKHGGSVRFETAPGVGTTFFIRIPLKPGPGTGRSR